MSDFSPAWTEPYERRSFRSHANYLQAFAMVIRGDMFVMPDEALQRVARAVAAFPSADGHGTHDQEALHGCFVRAWGTELLLATGSRIASDDELLRLTNSWGVIQAYYVGYSATQALILAEGHQRPTTHPATQRQAVDLWVTRGVAVAPWSFAVASHAHRHAAHDGTINGPGRAIDEQVHQWTACDPHSCWDIAALALRTTRTNAIDEGLTRARQRKLADRKRAWKAEEATRVAAGGRSRLKAWPKTAKLTSEETSAVQDNLRPYTLLDYLYRLRVKANYEDATVFTDGPDDDMSASRFAGNLELIASATMLAHELRVGRLIGRAPMLSKVDAWLTAHPQRAQTTLATRRDLLAQYL